MKSFKCIIIEDDIIEQMFIEQNLKHLPHIELIQIFSKPLDALPLIQSGTIDFMFVDIELPNINGIEFIKSLKNPPKVIFTTSHVGFAVEAFDIGVIDFLVKPYPLGRFLKAVGRAIDSGNPNESNEELNIYLKAGRELIKFSINDIVYIEAYGSFTKVHTDEKIVVISESISNLQDKIAEQNMLRVHKSYLVSKSRITAIAAKYILIDKIKIPLGNYYRENVEKTIQNDL
ncbi:Transcriptional regulatory protein YpdB [Emticicia aquatica]|jgi:DNA-binding LytR/AlgR family response regulator|uniref:Transcriptional regulatory protein YpdB n=1 Tax=Emticicia aquatica TaxID=1681835 RepID=A0ABM9ANF1_9BACT|nr:LytTR family DNA-binding domain-containing protein [Emticicia aquatica]CAH0995298.1 Transcriptional regulatory protein YpdB [Emticicia aquatica]